MTQNFAVKIWANTWKEYELLDSGNGKKLERFGTHILVREEPKAWWKPSLPPADWKKAHAIHTQGQDKRGEWIFTSDFLKEWTLEFCSISVILRTIAASKHIGIFPEQVGEWQWVRNRISGCRRKGIRVLNLFGYTGMLSLVAADAGASVVHVDASKLSIQWARDNERVSGIQPGKIRWILEDALKFLQRERRRGNVYDAVILDPPTFGRGPKKEVWKIEENLVPLLESSAALLSDNPLFVFLTTYRMGESSLVLRNLLQGVMGNRIGNIETGEFVLVPSKGEYVLPMSTFALWDSGKR